MLSWLKPSADTGVATAVTPLKVGATTPGVAHCGELLLAEASVLMLSS